MGTEMPFLAPPSSGRIRPSLRICGFSRARFLIVLAVTLCLLFASLFSHRPADRGLLLGPDDLLMESLETSVGYVKETSEIEEDDAASLQGDRANTPSENARPAVAIASMMYGDNEYYERAINTHIHYAERHGYPAYILRKDLVNGVWNKPAYLIHVLMTEMDKGQEGAPWIMWADADSCVVNPELPLDIFLPPEDFEHVHLLGSKDQNGFNAGMFFIRAHEWSVNILASAMALKDHNAEVMAGFAEQTALAVLFNQTENREHVLYQPRLWWNTYEWSFAYEGVPGDMFVHFVGLLEKRWERMKNWLKTLEGPEQEHWKIQLTKTKYPAEIDAFWLALRQGRNAMEEIRGKVSGTTSLPPNLDNAIKHLETVLWHETDQVEAVRNATEALNRLASDTPGLAIAGK